MVGVVGPERLPLFVVQKDVGPFLLHHTDSLLGGTLVHGHQITADKGSASSSASFTVDVNRIARGRHLVNKIHSSLQFLLIWRLKNVGGGKLEELDAQFVPALGLVGEEGELVVLVHGHYATDPLRLDHLFCIVRSEWHCPQYNRLIYPIVPSPGTDSLHGHVVGESGQEGEAGKHLAQLGPQLMASFRTSRLCNGLHTTVNLSG